MGDDAPGGLEAGVEPDVMAPVLEAIEGLGNSEDVFFEKNEWCFEPVG